MIKNVITINENALMEDAAMMMLKNDNRLSAGRE